MADEQPFPSPRDAGRHLVETGRNLPSAEEAPSTPPSPIIRTYVEGRIAADGITDLGVSKDVAARLLAEERAKANALIAETDEQQAAAMTEATEEQSHAVNILDQLQTEMQADPVNALASIERGQEMIQGLWEENERLKAALGSTAISQQHGLALRAEGYLRAQHDQMISGLQQRYPEFIGRDYTTALAALSRIDTGRAAHFQSEWEIASGLFSRRNWR